MGLNPQDLGRVANCIGDAVALELRVRFPENTTGHVARRLGCTKKQAENILGGHLSKAWHTRLIQVLGLGFAINVAARIAGESLEDFIQNRAAAARVEAEHWERLTVQELPLEPTASPHPDRLVEPRVWDRRGP